MYAISESSHAQVTLIPGMNLTYANTWADEVENQIATLNSPRDLFDKARSLTAVYRKIRQVLTDYEILLVSAKSMRKQNESIGKLLKLYADRHDNLQPSKELQHQLHLSFKQIRRELKLGKVYLTLYLERCNSGIADSHSVSTQHSAEVCLYHLSCRFSLADTSTRSR